MIFHDYRSIFLVRQIGSPLVTYLGRSVPLMNRVRKFEVYCGSSTKETSQSNTSSTVQLYTIKHICTGFEIWYPYFYTSTHPSSAFHNSGFTLIYIWATARQNQQNDQCTQRRLRSAWASAQADQSLRCALKGWPSSLCFFMQTVKTLIRLGGCPVWSESSLGAQVILLVLSNCGS